MQVLEGSCLSQYRMQHLGRNLVCISQGLRKSQQNLGKVHRFFHSKSEQCEGSIHISFVVHQSKIKLMGIICMSQLYCQTQFQWSIHIIKYIYSKLYACRMKHRSCFKPNKVQIEGRSTNKLQNQTRILQDTQNTSKMKSPNNQVWGKKCISLKHQENQMERCRYIYFEQRSKQFPEGTLSKIDLKNPRQFRMKHRHCLNLKMEFPWGNCSVMLEGQLQTQKGIEDILRTLCSKMQEHYMKHILHNNLYNFFQVGKHIYLLQLTKHFLRGNLGTPVFCYPIQFYNLHRYRRRQGRVFILGMNIPLKFDQKQILLDIYNILLTPFTKMQVLNREYKNHYKGDGVYSLHIRTPFQRCSILTHLCIQYINLKLSPKQSHKKRKRHWR